MRLRTANVASIENIPLRNFRGDSSSGQEILDGQFSYAGQLLDVGTQGDPWPLPAPSERFAFWFHSFDWLWDLTIRGEKEAGVKARTLVDNWINIYGSWNSYSWDNDILANRLYAWLSNWSTALDLDRMEPDGQARRNSLFRQVKRLRSTYRRTPDGLPKLKAATVVTMAGLFKPDKAYDYLNRGLDWMDEQIHLQILPDGGHVSRSPEACVEALEILTTLDQALEKRGMEPSPSISRALERLRHVVPFFQMPDQGLAGFNGGGIGNKKYIENLLKFSKTTASPFSYCPHTGYQRIHQKGTVLLIDTGSTTPYPFDQDAHLAPLAFEMSTSAGRLIVNPEQYDSRQSRGWRSEIQIIPVPHQCVCGPGRRVPPRTTAGDLDGNVP